MTTTFACFVKDCPWEASLRDGVWLCDKHDDLSTFVWGEEETVIWPKIAAMDRRIRDATERLIAALHRQPDAFQMFMDLTAAALGYEQTASEMEKRQPKRAGAPGGVE